MTYTYSTTAPENSARAVGMGLPISRKHSTMICHAIKGQNITKAKKYLAQVLTLEKPIKYTQYVRHQAHRPGIGPGRYPIKACKHILKILNNAEANAQFKGLSTGNLIITHAKAQQGPKISRQGRIGGQAKRTHIEIIVQEIKEQKARSTA